MSNVGLARKNMKRSKPEPHPREPSNVLLYWSKNNRLRAFTPLVWMWVRHENCDDDGLVHARERDLQAVQKVINAISAGISHHEREYRAPVSTRLPKPLQSTS